MATQKAFDLQSAYSDLNKACTAQAYEKIINVSGKILAKHPDEVKAFQCKVVAYIRTEKYEECLSFLKKNPSLVKLNRLSEAAKTLESADINDLKAQELKAQVDEYSEERLTNLAAVAAAESCFNKSYLVRKNSQQLFLIGPRYTCNLILSEDPEVTEEEKNEELAPIR
ncbi:unnamed protein product [Trichobilharzia regenti]|nr:unnamed protein product [Trichobilharzia regenti]